MLISIILLSLCIANNYAVPTTSDHWLNVQGIELINRDIKNITNIGNIEDCKEECTTTPECESFSYTESWPYYKYTCWFKKSAQNYVLKSGVNSFVKHPAMYQCFSNSDFNGRDFFYSQTSYNGCAKLCNEQRKKCTGFTWALSLNKTRGVCSLKTLSIDFWTVSANSRGSVSCIQRDAFEAKK
jgi:hypothetical protein